MKRFLAACLIALLTACASTPRSRQVDLAYDAVNTYVDSTKQMLARGRITPEQATKAAGNSDKAMAMIADARKALAGCTPQLPCGDFTSIMKGLQPNLLELERELREREKQK